ncbi:DUF2142 domain-containing protein [Streptococcus iniae]|uniref:DUF2142 domain-containing protein n=1 Tax=Streptococcus iniae TaxID=1346 RepID=UPI000EF6BB4A|nr:DUF2142 domain-containing protein [Streptococcus iniae]RLV18118.1 hypothetical protein DIX77_05740 [Streptococcus iniae]
MKVEKMYLLLASLLISLSILIMPVTQVPDERVHAHFAWEIVYQEKPQKHTWLQGTGIENKQPADKAINFKGYQKFFTQKIDFSKEKTRLKFSIVNIRHIPQLIGMVIGKMIYPSAGVIITAGRITNAFIYILAIYYLIKYIKVGKYTLMFISLLPMMIHQAGSLSYDVLNFVAIASFFVCYINLMIDKKVTWKKLFGYLLLIILLYAVKPNNLLLFPLIGFINFRFEGPYINKLNPILEFWQRNRLKIVVLLTLLCLIVLTFVLSKRTSVLHFIHMIFNTLFVNNLNPDLNNVLTTGVFGFFGMLVIQMPAWVIWLNIFVLTIVFLQEAQSHLNDVTTKEVGISSFIMVLLQVVVIIITMYFAWTPKMLGENANISVGAQGRYFTPFLLYLFPLFMSLKNYFNFYLNKKLFVPLVLGTIVFNYVIYNILIMLYYWV